MNFSRHTTVSRYLRADPRNVPVRRWAARAILTADFDVCFAWNSLDREVLPLFHRFDLDPAKQLDDADALTSWLERQFEGSHDAQLEESDPFTINSARIGSDLKLDAVELKLLRFALLKCQTVALKKSLELLGNELTLTDASYLLAHILELEPIQVQRAMHPEARLHRTGLIATLPRNRTTGDLDDWTMVPTPLLRNVFDVYPQGFSIEESLFGIPPKPTLTRRDFAHLGDRLDTLLDYMKSACQNRTIGANVLLLGPPGTGKTELARWLVRSTRRQAIEISAINAQGQSLDASERLETWQLCQGIMPSGKQRIVVFDEVEEILSDAGYATHGFRRSSTYGKGFLNSLLENNSLPTIWITNTLSGVDKAYLRRFDMTLHVPSPDESARRRIAKRAYRDLPVDSRLIDVMAARDRLTPAHMAKASRVCRIVGATSESRVDAVTRQVLDEDLRAMRSQPLDSPSTPEPRKKPPTLPTELEVLNTNINPDILVESLSACGFGRLCFYGPPGTGKTAFAACIAERMKRPLLVRQVSDILGPYVGMSEKNIADAFQMASEQGAVLLLDEADSFLQNRRHAEKHWQVTQVNQFLTSLERYEGYVICTTNLVEGLDPAALRRFDFKVEFGSMNEDQARKMVAMVLNKLGQTRVKVPERELQRLSQAELVPGDFAVALRQGVMSSQRVSAQTVVDTVLGEARLRAPTETRSIGFV